MTKNETFVIFADIDWGYIPLNKHHFAMGLSKYSKVIFIENKLEISFRNLTSLPNILRKAICRLNKINPNLVRYKPVGFPFARYNFIRRAEKRILVFDIRKLLGKERPIVLYYHPLQVEYVKAFNEKISIYHCVDESTYDYYDMRRSQHIADAEQDLISSTDFVIYVSNVLRHRKKDLAQKHYVIPSGYNEELFSYQKYNTDVPEDLKELRRPIIGSVGTSLDRLDLRLILYLALKNPSYSFVFLGFIWGERDDTFHELAGLKNVYFMGYRTPYDVPRYVSRFDACIIPYKMSMFNTSASPIKAFEYLALGKPVVSTPFPSLAEFDHVILFTEEEKEFDYLLKEALKNDDEDARLKRVEAVRAFTIESRVRRFLSILEEYL